MSDVKYGAWAAAEIPVQIKYSLIVIEEIRHEVAMGFQKMARGGIEVGGILYGRRDGEEIQILAMRPIVCEHALGPSFQLSAKDRAALGAQLDAAHEEPQLSEMAPVGYFVSHTRSEINLSPTDLEIYETYFGASWQIAMVIRPGRAGAMRAGFFARESDGLVRAERSYLEFNFPDRLAGVLVDRPRVEQRSGLDRRAPRSAMGISAVPAAAPALAPSEPRELPPLPEPHFTLLDRSIPEGPRRRKWPWLIAWGAVMVALTVVGLRYFVLNSGSEPISLSVLEKDGQLQIGWNHAARPVTSAARGTLEISDGGARKLISLTTDDLSRGNFTYQRRTSDVEVRITVEDQGGEKTQEASRFIGKTGEAESGKDQESRRNKLEAENERLRKENATQAQRIQQLETTIKIMQTRSGAQ